MICIINCGTSYLAFFQKYLGELSCPIQVISLEEIELELKSNQNSSFDFISIAYAKLLKRAERNAGILSKSNYYQACAMFFCLKKHQSRQLLRELAKRYNVTYGRLGVKFK